MKQRSILLILVALLCALILWQPRYDFYLQPYVLFGFGREDGGELEAMRLENAALRAELSTLRDVAQELSQPHKNLIPGRVFARYPFNLKDVLLVDVGDREGITVDNPVFFRDFLIGKVKEVFDTTAKVITIFDKSWQSAVRIGDHGIEALLSGGVSPRLSLIDKEAAVESGMSVVNAASQFSYGVPIGEIDAVTLSSDHLTQEATLKFPYDLGALRTVLLAN